MKYERTGAGYAEYLKSAHWDILRSCVLARDGNRCVRCGSGKRLQAHHKFYRDDWEQAQVSDLETLCRVCHEKEHPDKVQNTVVNVTVNVTVASDVCPFRTFKELSQARSAQRISRAEYLKWAPRLKPKKRDRRKKMNRAYAKAKAVRKRKRKSVACKPWFYNPNPPRPRWMNRGSSSN